MENPKGNDADESVRKQDLRMVQANLYRCWDMEITTLWQRSVFLAVFLTLVLSGYGMLVSGFFTDPVRAVPNYSALHGAAVALSVLGFTLSVIWILMAKGSKAWYEVYAMAISEFEDEFGTELGIPQIYRMGQICFLDGEMEAKDRNDRIENIKLTCIGAGAYSVSKLNILIGWVFLIGWSVVAVVHGACLLHAFQIASAIWGVRYDRQCDGILCYCFCYRRSV